MRILALDASAGWCSVGVFEDSVSIIEKCQAVTHGQAATLATMLAHGSVSHAISRRQLTAVAVTTGPGSFTGVRSAIALATGVAAASCCDVIGVTTSAAIAACWQNAERPLWTAIDSRRGYVFLVREGVAETFPIGDIPRPSGKIAIAGNAGRSVAAFLAARGFDVLLTQMRRPSPAGVAACAFNTLKTDQGLGVVTPTYVDAAAARVGPRSRGRPHVQ